MARKTKSLRRLSIGLPVYNGEKYLEDAILGLLRQTFSDFELIVCDNASEDRTSEICLDLSETDDRIKYYRNTSNLGAHPNFEKVFRLSSAPLFKWAAADDLCETEYLESCVQILDENPTVVLAHSGTAFIDEFGKPFPVDSSSGSFLDPKTGVSRTPDPASIATSGTPAHRFWSVLTQAKHATHMFGVIRRDNLERTGLLRNFTSSDRVMLAELALQGPFKSSQQPLFRKRYHPDVSWTFHREEMKGYLSSDDARYSRRLRQLRYFFGAPWQLPCSFDTRIACTAMTAVHTIRTAAEILSGKDRREYLLAESWRASRAGSKMS